MNVLSAIFVFAVGVFVGVTVMGVAVIRLVNRATEEVLKGTIR